jgi:hypothetical protein
MLPLVKGGALHVGRPLGARAIAAMVKTWRAGTRRSFTSLEDMAEEDALAELGRVRQARARALIHDAAAPALDEVSLRLGVGVHNLLALGHPALGGGVAANLAGRALERRQQQIVDATLPIADLGPPPTAEEALRRHSLLARMGEITRTEHVVEYWAGMRRYVGRPPPAALVALPRLRRVATTSMRRLWWKEIGVPACGRPLWMALHRASPLIEALDPVRLDPPLAWERILPVLRFPALCRVVAGHLLEIGLESAGTALVSALHRFVALPASAGSSPAAVAFAVKFLAHLCWLQHLFRGNEELAPTSELAAMLVAAAEVEPALVWPPDVPASAALFAGFQARLERLAPSVRARAPEKYQMALNVCRLGAGAAASTAAIVGGPS